VGKSAAQMHDAFMNGGKYVFNNSSCQTIKLNFVAIVLPLYYKQNLKWCIEQLYTEMLFKAGSFKILLL